MFIQIIDFNRSFARFKSDRPIFLLIPFSMTTFHENNVRYRIMKKVEKGTTVKQRTQSNNIYYL
jgi:hypothetical protein